MDSVRIPGLRQITRQRVTRGVVDDCDMNRDIVSRFGGDLGGRWGIATGIPTVWGARRRPPTVQSDVIVRPGGVGRRFGLTSARTWSPGFIPSKRRALFGSTSLPASSSLSVAFMGIRCHIQSPLASRSASGDVGKRIR